MTGRLSLSWVNKDLALMMADDGGYRWVEREDPDVTAVRLLEGGDRVGEVTGTPADNLLIQGDNYHALHALARIPEYAEQYLGKVKLVYIDPPFNTGQAFEHYDDSLEHSVWLGMMRERLLLIRELMAADGSLWVHLDDAEMAYCRALLDEVFGRRNFIGTVIWQKIHARNNSAQHISADHDYILLYARDKTALTLGRVDRTELSDSDFWNPDNDPRGRWRRSDLTASHEYSEKYEVTGPYGDPFVPRENRWWSVSRETFEALRADNRIWWGVSGRTFPFRKRFESELGGLVPTTIWLHDFVGDNREAKGELTRLSNRSEIFSTPKPERLMKRIIELATEPGDIVLDCFAGSGTTGAVAHKLGRRWVMMESSPATVRTFTKPRLEKVVNDQDDGGITQETVEEFEGELPDEVAPSDVRRTAAVLGKLLETGAFTDIDGLDGAGTKAVLGLLRSLGRTKKRVVRHWSGGGGFRVLEVGPAPYLYAAGRVLLTDWVKEEMFAKTAAAQLGFSFQPDGPFVGRRGFARLAVVDGVADDVGVKSIVSNLDDGELVTIVAKGVAPGAEEALRQLSTGSRLVKAPDDLARRGKVVR